MTQNLFIPLSYPFISFEDFTLAENMVLLTGLSLFLIGRMFPREASWKYSTKLVGS